MIRNAVYFEQTSDETILSTKIIYEYLYPVLQNQSTNKEQRGCYPIIRCLIFTQPGISAALNGEPATSSARQF